MRKYRIQKRKMSSNIIEESKDNGKSWKPYLAPLCKKEEGDELAEMLVFTLNSMETEYEPEKS